MTNHIIKPLYRGNCDEKTTICTNSASIARYYLENGIPIDVGNNTVEIVSAVIYTNSGMVRKDDDTFVITFFDDNESIFSPHCDIALQCATLI